MEEALVAVDHQLAIACQPLQRLALEHASRIDGQIVEHATLENEKAGIHQAVDPRLLPEPHRPIPAIDLDHAEARFRLDGRHRRQPAMRLVKAQECGNVDIGDAVAIGHHERAFGQITLHPLDPGSGHAVGPGLGKGDPEVAFRERAMEGQLVRPPERHREVARHGLVVEDVALDLLALVAEAQHEVGEPVDLEVLHDVPEDRLIADLHQRLRDRFRVLAQSRALAAAKNDHGHLVLRHRFAPSSDPSFVLH